MPEALGQGIATWRSTQGVVLVGSYGAILEGSQAEHKPFLVNLGSKLSYQLMGDLKPLCPLEHQLLLYEGQRSDSSIYSYFFGPELPNSLTTALLSTELEVASPSHGVEILELGYLLASPQGPV